MQMTIDVPDTLPQERLKQRIKELEQSLIMKSQFFAVFSKQQTTLTTKETDRHVKHSHTRRSK
jgi:hypothetical protein